jgi:hypothetical protein
MCTICDRCYGHCHTATMRCGCGIAYSKTSWVKRALDAGRIMRFLRKYTKGGRRRKSVARRARSKSARRARSKSARRHVRR